MGRYKIVESVRGTIEPVSRWTDIENHHPGKEMREAGRVYAKLAGRAEEMAGNYKGTAIYTPGGQPMVSKDFILLDRQTSNASVPVPAPANGYVGDVSPRSGTVTLLDRPGGELMFVLRHMRIYDEIRAGARVEYGQPLGVQSGFGKGVPRYFGTHVHVDVNVRYLDQADRWVRDMAQGAITTDQRPRGSVNLVGDAPKVDALRGHFPMPPEQALADGVIQMGERGPDVALLQERLRAAGVRDSRGGQVGQDGHFGADTRDAVQQYQRTQGIPETGVADTATLERLQLKEERQHPERASSRERTSERDIDLKDKLREQVRILDAQAGKPWDDASERLFASAHLLAKENGFTARDELKLAFNRATDRMAAGEVLHLVRAGAHASPDPYANRVHMAVSDALAMPAADRFNLAQAMSQQPRSQDFAHDAAERQRGPERAAHAMPTI